MFTALYREKANSTTVSKAWSMFDMTVINYFMVCLDMKFTMLDQYQLEIIK